jgi:uncharacterized protein YndB with AHSA1/START domain
VTGRGFKDATTDPEQIEAWWVAQPMANIGIPTQGLIVIDVDGADNPWLVDEPDKLLDLAVAPQSRTGNGGRQYIFRQPPGRDSPYRNTAGSLAPHVDTRADGGYIVVPPSVLEGDKRYAWVPECGIEDGPESLPLPPAWLVEMLDALAAPASPAPCGASGESGTSARANVVPSGQRNATLARLAGAMRRVGMGQAEIAAALHATNDTRCDPPLPPQEVERIAESIARYEPDAVATALVENHYEQDRPRPRNSEQPDDAVTAADDPGPFPEDLLNVPGFVREVADHTLRTAPYPQPLLAFAGALTLQAFLAGQKVRDATDSRTNLYVLALANSGAGKDHPRKVNQRILMAADLPGCIGDKFASGEGIEDRLFAQPSMLFQTDEIDGLMQSINRAGDARHESILNVLLKMYTSGNALYPMRVKAGKDEPGVIDQPSLCMLGTAVPRYYYEALSMRMLNNGFFARLLILEASKRGEGQDPSCEDLPPRVVETAQWWSQYEPGGNSGANLARWHPRPALVPETSRATAVFRELRTEADVRYARAEEKDDPTAMAIWARAYEKARKLALIYAVSENNLEPRISESAATWAWRFVDYQTRRMLFMAAQHVADGEFDAKCKRMVEVLSAWRQRRGDAWMPHWDMSRRLKWSDRELDEVRDGLLGQERIEFQSGSTARGGRSGLRYRLTPEVSR